jgi:hypothetical protein
MQRCIVSQDPSDCAPQSNFEGLMGCFKCRGPLDSRMHNVSQDESDCAGAGTGTGAGTARS